MAPRKNDKPAAPGLGDDDSLLTGINFNNAGEADGLGLDEGRPLPKKVELDIDDMILEEDEEPPETTEPEPVEEAAPVEEPEPAPKKFSKIKLALLAGAALLLITAIAIPVIIMTGGEEVKVETPQPANPLDNLIQDPFVVNFPGAQKDIILKMTVSLSFPNQAVQQEFQARQVVMRDLIFRYAQGAGAEALNDPEYRDQLNQELAQLINENLKQGQVKRVAILEIITL